MSPRRAKVLEGRAGDDPAAALRDHLIDAAERLIAQQPITAITTRDIARAAAVSDGVLYNYFADKNELIVTAILRQYRGIADRFIARIPEPGSATVEQNLTAIAEALYDLASDVVPMVASLLVDPPLFHRLFNAMHQEPFGPELIQTPLLDYLEREQRLGRLSGEARREAVTQVIVGTTAVLALAAHVVGRDPAPGAGIPELVDLLMRGLQPGR